MLSEVKQARKGLLQPPSQIRRKLGSLMSQVHRELASLGILTTRPACKEEIYTLRITKQQETRRFMEIVGPRLRRLRNQ